MYNWSISLQYIAKIVIQAVIAGGIFHVASLLNNIRRAL